MKKLKGFQAEIIGQYESYIMSNKGESKVNLLGVDLGSFDQG